MKIPKCKKCRRAGDKLFLKGDRCPSVKCSLTRRSYAPGLHGQKYKRALSEYGVRLREKQKLRHIYGISEKQLRNYFKKAQLKKTNISDFLIHVLETRLDNVILRGGLAISRSQARQRVSHKFFTVNKKKINIPSYNIKAGDLIQILDSKKKKVFIENLKTRLKLFKAPSWLEIDKKQLEIKIINLPTPEHVDHRINMQLVVEYYSK